MQPTPHPTTSGPATSGPATSGPATCDEPAQLDRIVRALRKKSFAVVSTVSAAGYPHSAGVVYDSVGTTLYVHTMRSSRKARNVAQDDRVAVVVPVRRLPIGPPFTIQFQGRAELISMDDPVIAELLADRRLAAISGHGALEEPDGVFLRITPGSRVHTYGIGVSALAIARDPLHEGARVVELT